MGLCDGVMTAFFEKHERKILWGIVAVSFFASVAYAFYFRVAPFTDARAHHNIAVNLAAGNGYRERTDVPLIDDPGIGRSGPGYEFFLAFIYAVFGVHLEIIWVIQALLHAFSVWLLYGIAKKVFCCCADSPVGGSLAGLSAAALFGFSPDLIEMGAMLMTETLYLFLLIVSFALFARYLEERRLKIFFAFSFVFGLSLLVRSLIGILAIVVLGVLCSGKRFFHGAVFIAVLSAILAPWSVRNYLAYGAFIPTRSTFGYALWVGNNTRATGELASYEEIEAYQNEHTILEVDTKGRQEAARFALRHPLLFVRLLFAKMSMYFSVARPTGFWPHLHGGARAFTVLISALFSLALFAFGVSGALTLLNTSHPITRSMLWFAALTPIPHMLTIVETRYRYQIYPLLMIFAGIYIAWLFTARTRALWYPFGLALALVLLNTAVDIAAHSAKFIDGFHLIFS